MTGPGREWPTLGMDRREPVLCASRGLDIEQVSPEPEPAGIMEGVGTNEERPSLAPPGHDAWVEQTEGGGRWRARCSCGWNDPSDPMINPGAFRKKGVRGSYRTDAVQRFALARAVKHVSAADVEYRRSQAALPRPGGRSAPLSQPRGRMDPAPE